MNARSVRKGHTQRATDGADRQVLEQEVARLRTLLREARADTRRETWAEVRRRFRLRVAGLGLIALIIGGLIGHYGFPGEPPMPESAQAPAPPMSPGPANSVSTAGTGDQAVTTPWPISVYVSGAVAKAQVVELPAGSLIADALDRAGGAGADADLDAVNLAAPLVDNQHVVVPRLTDRVSSAATQQLGTNSTPAALIDINTASPDELESLPYIGGSRAADIVSYRAENRPFERIEDIQNVPGIGPTIYEHIAHLITIED
ncbi:MAG: ComEA family DNA-binding protein [Anaerolineae bacterium]|nr:ComEA family DNA-binding protein [Anaerolineae bacterium]